MASMPLFRMGPPPRSSPADAHYCIMVRVSGPTEYKDACTIYSCAISGAPLLSSSRHTGRSNHLPAIVGSKITKPVTLPPGRAKLSTKPLPTGSETLVKTIGMVRVCCSKAAVVGVLCDRTRSGWSAMRSFARRGISPVPGALRVSPYECCDPPSSRTSAARLGRQRCRLRLRGRFQEALSTLQFAGWRPVARAPNGDATAPPTSAMNSRRLIQSPRWPG
jgi:hypothetical protein